MRLKIACAFPVLGGWRFKFEKKKDQLGYL
jgi:hypothetical protein